MERREDSIRLLGEGREVRDRGLWLRAFGWAAAVASVGAWTTLLGCGGSHPTMGTAGIERAIAATMVSQRGVHAAVECPERVARKRGTAFTCTAALDVGRYPVSVVESNDMGQVRYSSVAPLVKLDTARVARAIERSIERQRRLRAEVRCPREVLQQAGLVFDCRASVGGRSYRFEVTERDGRGHVVYVGR